MLIIAHTDPIYHLPNRAFVEQAMQKISLVVEINAYNDSQTEPFAHIQLPALPWGEKEGAQTNLDRTISKQNPIFAPSGEARQDWQIFADIGKTLGYEQAFAFANSEEVFEEFARMCSLSKEGHLDINQTSYAKLEKAPHIWGEGLFANKEFFTPNKKANLHFVTNQHLSEKTSPLYPLNLLTGRIRDSWHSGTKTNCIERLKKHKPNNFVEIHPIDAKKLEIKEGDKVSIASARGSLESYAVLTLSIHQGHVFVPISHTRINHLTNSLLDPISKQPDYNQSAVKVTRR